MPVLSIRIVLDSFYLLIPSIRRNSQLESAVCRKRDSPDTEEPDLYHVTRFSLFLSFFLF